MSEIVQVVLGEEKNGAGFSGNAVIDSQHLDGVRLTDTGLELTDPNMPLEHWLNIGRMFGYMQRTINWWLGDWINKGEALYGEFASQGVESSVRDRYSEAERITGIGHQTMMNIASICSRVARSRRRSELGFWIHAEVAKMEPKDQKHWLALAVKNNWQREDLRAAIRDEGRELPPPVVEEGGDGGGEDAPSRDTSAVMEAAERVVRQGIVRGNQVHIPLEAWRQLAASLGE